MEFLSTIYIESRYPPDIGLLPSGEPGRDDADRSIRVASSIYDFFMRNY
jgi:HEPN domain-containing protein